MSLSRRRLIGSRRAIDLVLDVIYGSRCAVCESRRSLVGGPCEACRGELTPDAHPRCPHCAEKLGPHVPTEPPCPNCRTRRYRFRSTRTVFDYAGSIRRQIHAAKFQQSWHVTDRLVSVFARSIAREMIPEEVSLVVPVPMFWWDRRTRGVHLSSRLSEALSLTHAVDHGATVLMQLRRSPPQFGLSSAERFRNVEGLFAVRAGVELERRSVLLVDDVMTTGATASECARTLRKAGAGSVHVAVLARTGPRQT